MAIQSDATEAREPRGIRKALVAITLFLLNIGLMGENGFLPITNIVYELFGNGFLSNYIISSASLWMAVGAMLSTWLMRRMTKKWILVIGSACFAVGSIFCVSIESGLYIAFMRSLMGLGEGIIGAVSMAYIAQMYVDSDRRAAFTGYFNAFGTLTGAVLSFASGELAMIEWAHAFYVFFPMVLVVVMAVVVLPELGMEEADESEASKRSEKAPLGKLYLPFIVDYVLFAAMFAITAFFISVYVAETGLGDAALAGRLLALNTASGFFSAAAFGKIYAKLRKNSVIPCIILSAAAMLAMWLFRSVVVCYIACAVLGAGYGVYFAYSYAYPADVVPPERVDDAIGYTTAIYTLAFFLVPYLVSWIMSVSGGSVVPAFAVGAGFGVVAIAIELATNGAYKRAMGR